jgi:hypothetical protein
MNFLPKDSRLLSQAAAFGLGICAVFLSGCANGFEQFYQPSPILSKNLTVTRLAPYSGQVSIYSTNNLRDDAQRLQQDKKLYLGSSNFTTTASASKSQIIAQAKFVQADFVLVSSNYLGSEQAFIPIVHYNPGTTTTTTSNGTVNANAYGSGGYAYGTANYQGNSTSTTSGTYSSTVVPVTRQRYEYHALFFRTFEAYVLGVGVNDLTDTEREALQRNSGVKIVLVVNDSNAFMANLLVGDVLTKIDGKEIETAGRKVPVCFLRNGVKHEVMIKMESVN